MRTLEFQTTFHLSARVSKNSRPTEFGELLITGTGIEDKDNVSETHRADITSIKFNGVEILPVLEYMEHVSTGMDAIYTHCLDYVIEMFGKAPAKPTKNTIQSLKQLAKAS